MSGVSVSALSRRRFLEVTGLLGGGLLIGCRIGRDPLPAASGRTGAAGAQLAPNAWVSITRDGIVLTCHRNEMGQDVHTSLAMIIAEELEVDPREVRIEQAPADPERYTNALLGAQITGGSTSVRDAWEPLRRAGATAREMLVAAAAARWGVSPSECRAERGRVRHARRGRLSYAELAAEAATRPAPADVPLKAVDSFRVIGSGLERLDGAAKVRGQTDYGIDVKQPGMLHAALVACPVLGGRTRSVDAEAARRRQGVRAVVDLGEAVAVVAEHWYTAHAALSDLEIRWDEGPGAALDDAGIRAALEEAAPKPGAVVRQAGEAEAVLARSQSLSARYTTQPLAHMTLEPQNCLARVDADGVEVWASTQFPQRAQTMAAEVAGVDPARVRIHSQMLGGGFGRRLDVDFIGQAVAIAKAVPGAPVKLIWSREEDVTHDFYRPPSLHLLRGAVADGAVSAFQHKLVSPSVTSRAFPAFVQDGIDPFMVEGTADFGYAIPHLELRNVIREVGLRVGYWRSVSHAQNAFAIECFLDELAHAAGRDPVELRLAMLDELPRQAAVLRRAAEESGYRPGRRGGRAFGVAAMPCYGSHVALVAELSGGPEAVRVEQLRFALDCGVAVHPDQVIAQIEGAAVTGLMGALRAKITLRQGRVEQENFDSFPIPRLAEVPPHSRDAPSRAARAPGGIGEVGTPLGGSGDRERRVRPDGSAHPLAPARGRGHPLRLTRIPSELPTSLPAGGDP